MGKRTFLKNFYFISFLTACLAAIWLTIKVWGTQHTVQSHAYALSNLWAIMVIPVMILTNKELHKFEKVGCLTVILACSMLIMDKWSLRSDSLIEVPGKKYYKHVPTLGVDVLLTLSNVPAAIFFSFNRSLMRKRFLVQICLLFLLTTFVFSICAMLFEESGFNLNRQNGLFGWLDSSNCFSIIFFYGFFATFFGSVGYIIAMQFLPTTVCLNAYLLEPFVAQVLGCLFGID